MRKAVWTLNIDNYNPDITKITYPLIKRFASWIKADFNIITERKFPEWPVVYEKLQIHKLGEDYDWNIYLDSDALVHPELFDITAHLKKDTIVQNAKDVAYVRFRPDEYTLRDGRHIGACNWFTIASNWCLDLWKPLENITPTEAIANIQVVCSEQKFHIEPSHLIDDYVLSRNIARYGLKHTTFQKMLIDLGIGNSTYFWHNYEVPTAEKAGLLANVLTANWKVNLEQYL